MGAIAGGIVGALILVGCVAGVLFWYIRRKKRASEEMDVWLDNTKNVEEEEKEPGQTASIRTHGSVWSNEKRSNGRVQIRYTIRLRQRQ
jgi:hypothetical protein